MISGFVITASLASRKSRSLADLLIGFYSRRVRRLLPALIVYVIIAGLLLCLLMPDPAVMLGMGRRALFGISNIQFYRDSMQYFSESASLNPYTHTWSLGVEEQFYLLFPLLIFLTGFTRPSQRTARNLGLVTGILSVLSLALFIYLYPRNQPAAYFLMPSRFWEMGLGSLLLLFCINKTAASEPGSRLHGYLSATAVAVLFLAFFLPIKFAVASTILAVMSTCLLIFTTRKGTFAYRALTRPLMLQIGLISYSLYLWHWGVISFSRLSIGIHWWSVPFQVLLIVGLSLISYRSVESPVRNYTWLTNGRRTISLGLVSLIAASIVLFIFAGALSERAYLGRFFSEDFTYVQKQMSCELMSIHTDRNGWRSCLQRPDQRPVIFVLGDSHASNLVPSFQAIASQMGFTSVRYLTNAMPHPFHTNQTKAAAAFWDNSAEYRRFIQSLQPNDVVVYSRAVSTEKIGLQGLQKQLSMLATDAPARGAILVLVDDIPPTCAEEDFRRGFLLTGGRGCGVWKHAALAKRKPHTQILKDISEASASIIYFDPFPVLCDQDQCYPTLNGQILYADTSPHFSQSNPSSLAPFFLNGFKRAGILATARPDHLSPLPVE